MSIFFCGIILTHQSNTTNILLKHPVKEQVYNAQIIDLPVEKTNSVAVLLQINAANHKSQWQKQPFKMLVYIEKDTLSKELKAGDKLIIYTKPQAFEKNLNPFGFDYSRYMELKHIHYTSYLKSDQWKHIGYAENLKTKALNFRHSLVQLYINAGIKVENLAVFSALTLGHKEYLDLETKKAFAGSGAMHVLAVSGMHVGIVILILQNLLSLFGAIKTKLKVQYLVILIGIWCYAFITGLSPSITRACTMASFVLFGLLINKKITIYNSLAASAFFMLCYNPNYLYDVGFQLSYLAILGIVICYNKIYHIVYIKNKILDTCWKLTAVAISAQIGTFPLGIFYFNQLPSYFWLSGALVVMAAYILMYLALVLIVFSFINNAAIFCGLLITGVTKALNSIVFGIYKLPFSIIPFYNYAPYQIFICYGIVIISIVWIATKKSSYLITSLALLLLLTGIKSSEKIACYGKKQFAVYHLPKSTAIQLIDNRNSIWLQIDTTNYRSQHLFSDAENYWFLNYQHIKLDNNTYESSPSIYQNNQVVSFGTKKMLIISQNTKFNRSNTLPLVVDYLLVTDNSKLKVTDIPTSIKYHTIIVDGSIPQWRFKFWKKKGVTLHYTATNGAFIVENI